MESTILTQQEHFPFLDETKDNQGLIVSNKLLTVIKIDN